jgi:NitT/TauT family transport system substrate-binding protein
MQIVLAENFRAVFYAPFYACLELGFFSAQGLDVVLKASPSPGAGIADMLSGATHLVWGGPMRVLKDRDTHPYSQHSLVAFGEVAARDPFHLLGRRSLQPFALHTLGRLKLAAVSETVTPWLCLQQDLRDLGMDPDAIERAADASMADNLKALEAGHVDVAQVFEPYVTLAERAGLAVPLYAAHLRGPTAYTTFLSTGENLERHDAPFRAMARALSGFPAWLTAEGTPSLARLVGSYYPHVEPGILEQSLARGRQSALWTCRPEVSREGFARLAQSLLSGRYIDHAASYETCVAAWAQEAR